jgi:hypothetical protein
MPNFTILRAACGTILGCLVGCAGADGDDVATEGQSFAATDPTKAECDRLDRQVDSCLDELGSIGGSLQDCMPEKTPLASACCKKHGKDFNFCKAPEPSPPKPPSKADCERLAKRVDSCLDELGSIGGSLESCISKKDPEAVACCATHGKKFNFCR